MTNGSWMLLAALGSLVLSAGIGLLGSLRLAKQADRDLARSQKQREEDAAVERLNALDAIQRAELEGRVIRYPPTSLKTRAPKGFGQPRAVVRLRDETVMQDQMSAEERQRWLHHPRQTH